ncbi:DNA-binding protein [Methylobacterium sp. W2]|nr:DNA-binding protein [Methylobacterium sp. W2]
MHGTPVAIATLAKLRCIGGGPKFDRFGRSIFYVRSNLDAWVSGRLNGARRSTSETDEQ